MLINLASSRSKVSWIMTSWCFDCKIVKISWSWCQLTSSWKKRSCDDLHHTCQRSLAINDEIMWWTYAIMMRYSIESTTLKVLHWKYYIEYLHAKLSNSEICNFQTKCWFETAKQRVNQSIMNFKQYFIRLYADLNYHIFNETHMMYLQMKINEIIMNESFHISYISINYVNLLKHFINIDLHLQNTDTLLKLNSQQQSESVTFQKRSQFLHEKMKSIIATKNLKFFALSTQFKDDTLKFSEFKQNAVLFNFMCWSCKKLRHKIDNLMCFNYAFRQKTCNHDEEVKKEKVWCLSLNH
jgi:hypothetical protein